MRFALMQVKTGLCHILSRFEVAPCKETPVRVVYDTKAIVLQMYGEVRLSFNRMQLWNLYIYIHAQYILNSDKNIYLKTSLEKPSSRRPYFLGKYESAVFITSSTLSGHLSLTKRNCRKYFTNLILKYHFWLSDLNVNHLKVSWSQSTLNPILADILSLSIAKFFLS